MIHPFPNYIPPLARTLIIGTLPPEGASFFYSNSRNNRFWDILRSINEASMPLPLGGYALPLQKKKEILQQMGLGCADIIMTYERNVRMGMVTTSDTDIIPHRYQDILSLACENGIRRLVFVYKSALLWFIHSLDNESPVLLSSLKGAYTNGEIVINDKRLEGFEIILLPSPLSRGRKGETLVKKAELYARYLKG